MSLIHDYLKKTEGGASAVNKSGVPPALFGAGRKKRGNGVVVVGVLVCVALAAAFYFQQSWLTSEVKQQVQNSDYKADPASTQSQPEEDTSRVLVVGKISTNQPLESSEASAQQVKSSLKIRMLPAGKENVEDAGYLDQQIAQLSQSFSDQETYGDRHTPADPVVQPQAVPVQRELAQPLIASSSKMSPQQTQEKEKAVSSPSGEDTMQQQQEKISRYYQAGLLSQQDGNLVAAEKIYTNTLQLMPGYVETLTNLSAVYIRQGKYQQARDIIGKILVLEPGNSKAMVNQGMISLKQKDFLGAKEWFLKAVSQNPAEETALINLAFLAEKEGDLAAAERYYYDILVISPGNKDVLLSYGALLEKTGRFAEAQACYRRSLELDTVKQEPQLAARIRERIQILATY